MEIVVNILSSAAVSAALTAVLVFLFRSWISERIKNAIKYEYDQKMEIYKSQLKTEHQREIENLKAKLQIVTSTHQIQFESLHVKIAETVAGVYARIVQIRRKVADYVKIIEFSNDPSREERRKAAAEAFGEFRNYYEPHRLYLSKELIKHIENFEKILFNTTSDFMWQVEMPDAQGGHQDIEAWQKVSRTMSDTIPDLLENLEDEFRSLLGQSITPPQETE